MTQSISPGNRRPVLSPLEWDARRQAVRSTPDLVAFWSFQPDERSPFDAEVGGYSLRPRGSIQLISPGVFGPSAVLLRRGQWLELPRSEVSALDVSGPLAKVSVVSWIVRHAQPDRRCEAVAGMWDETRSKRQYCLFLNLPIRETRDEVGGHVSAAGGPTPPFAWCTEASVGATAVTWNQWHTIGFTYDARQVISYLDGGADIRPNSNPFIHDAGLLSAGTCGSAFTVGAVHNKGAYGNWFAGVVAGVSVFSRALSPRAMRRLAFVDASTPTERTLRLPPTTDEGQD